jgi:protein-disulfide isomerase
MQSYRLAALSAVLAALLAMAPVPTAGQQPAAPPPVVIDTRDAPALGPENAPVTIVEFGDFQCPFCAQGAKSLRKFLTMYPDRVRWVFMHYPLRVAHPHAALAHEAAVAAQEQGKFWEMHDLIMRNQTNIRYGDLVRYAEEIGLDMGPFKDALDTRRLRGRVIHDLEEGRRLRVPGTPTYFVNGKRVVGAQTTYGFHSLVDAIIRQPAAAAPPESADAPAVAPGAPPAAPGASSESPVTR